MEYYKSPRGSPTTWHGEGYTKISKKEHDRLVVLEAGAYLKHVLGEDPKVVCTVLQVSASGMSRQVMVQTIVDGTIRDVSSRVAEVLGWRQTKRRFVVVSGCGMDMLFHTRDSLSYALYGKGGKIAEYR